MGGMAGTIRQMHRSFIRIHALSLAVQEGEIYGIQIRDRLARYGYTVSPGTLYPVLHDLEAGGLLKSQSRVVEGKHRRYYRATPRGCEFLLHMKPLVRELADVLLKTALPCD